MAQALEFFDELKQSLANCQAADANTRQAGEDNVRRMRDENVIKLFATLMREIADEGNDQAGRQMACIIAKNLVSVRQTDPCLQDLWLKFEPTFKQNVKDACMSALGTEAAVVRNQIASLIATIAQIEIPRGEWTELLSNLCSNASNENWQVRLTSLTTIGYICEELQPEHLTQELKNAIMMALTNNISKEEANVEPCRLAVGALLNSIPYTSTNFQVQAERDFLMSKILDEALQSVNTQIREKAMQCLVEIARQEYNMIQPYMDRLWQATSHLAKNDQGDVGSQAIEFWTTIAEVEVSRVEKQGQVLGYITHYKDALLQLLIECISNVQIEDEDDAEEEWGVNLASGCCLVKVSQLLRSDVLGPVVAFVQQNVMHAEWQKRYAALIALGAVADGPDKPAFAQLIQQSSAQLFNMFKDQSIKVREAIAWVMLQICTHHSDVMASTTQQTQEFITVIIQSLPDRPRVSIYLCQAIEKLAESLTPTDLSTQESNQLTPHFEVIAQALFVNAARVADDDINTGNGIVQMSFASLTSLCQASCVSSDASLQAMLVTILTQLQGTIETPAQGSTKTLEVQSVLCGLVQVIMVRIGHNVDVPTADRIVALIIQSFQQNQRVTEAGLIAYQGVCLGLKERVPIQEIGKYIYSALDQKEDEDATRLAIGLVVDIADGLREQVSQYLSSLVPLLLNVLKDQSRKQDTKLAAIQSLASVACYASQSFCQFYLIESLTLLRQAAEISVKEEEFQNDPDTLDYLSELRSALIEAYSQVTIGVHDSNSQAQFMPFIEGLFSFLYQAALKERTMTNFKAVGGLLGDLAGCLKGQIATPLQLAWIKELLEHLKGASNDNEAKETAMWAWQQINDAVKAGGGAPVMQ